MKSYNLLSEIIYKKDRISEERTAKKHVNQINPLKETLLEYCSSSTLHGVQYITDTGRPLIERSYWLVSMVVSLAVTCWMITVIWNRWSMFPVKITLSEKTVPTWSYPFPTVTICPPSKYRRSIFDFQKATSLNMSILPSKVIEVMNEIKLVCANNHVLQEDRLPSKLFPNETANPSMRFLTKVAPSLEETLMCQHHYNNDCLKTIKILLTKEGQCFSYNYLPSNQMFPSSSALYNEDIDLPFNKKVWSPEEGYHSFTADFKYQPMRALYNGFDKGLLMILNTNNTDIDPNCDDLKGFKVSFTNPAEIPSMSMSTNYVPTRGFTQVAVETQVHVATSDLRDYDPHERGCYFNSEKTLVYFNYYTRSNCWTECQSNFTYEVCGCVAFYMPRNNSMAVCGAGSSPCVTRSKDMLHSLVLEENIRGNPTRRTCGCLAPCVSINYKVEITRSPADVTDIVSYVKNYPEVKEPRNSTQSIVIIYMKRSNITPIKRRPYRSYPWFFSTCGGLLGFCCGFSILSIAELVYYFTLRLWTKTLHLRQREECKRRMKTTLLR